jgi:LPS-assembly protein
VFHPISDVCAAEKITEKFSNFLPNVSEKDAGFLVYAHEVIYEKESDVLCLKGAPGASVQLRQKNQYLEADRIEYLRKEKSVIARGHVMLVREDGDIIKSDYMKLTDNFKKGFIRHVRFLMKDKSRFVARNGLYIRDEKIIFNNAVYTPCFPCENSPKCPPFWQINARKVIKDDKNQEVICIHPQIRVADVPVLYLPYLSFGTGRSSGFLIPNFGTSSNLGFFTKIPYYIAFPHCDVTLTPFITTKKGFLTALQYNHQKTCGYWKAWGTLRYKSSPPPEKDNKGKIPKMRGNFSLFSQFNLTPKWRLNLDGNWVSDKTYFRLFEPFSLFKSQSSKPFLKTTGYVERFTAFSYFSLGGITYQGLRDSALGSRTPTILPEVFYTNTVTLPWGTFFKFDGHGTVIERRVGNNYQRSIVRGQLSKTVFTPYGQIFTFFGGARVDAYHAQVFSPEMPTQKTAQGSTLRFMPQAGVMAKWPLFTGGGYLLFEPLAQIILTPKQKKTPKIPQEDSLGFELNNSMIFRENRFPGYDSLDDNSRFTYGLNMFLKRGPIRHTRIFFGQSYTFVKTSKALLQEGVGHGFSNIVGNIQADPFSWLSFDYRFRLGKKRVRLQFGELSAKVGPEKIRVGLRYLHFIKKPSPENLKGTTLENLTYSIESILWKNWRLEAEQTRDLNGKKLLSEGVILTYQNECFKSSLGVSKTFFKIRDVQPATVVAFTIVLKNLGSTSYSWSRRKDPDHLHDNKPAVPHPLSNATESSREDA